MFSINIWSLYINFDLNFQNKLPNIDFNNYIFQKWTNIIQEILILIKKRIIISLKM